MTRTILLMAMIAVASVGGSGNGFSLSADSIVQLKSAGVSDATIELMVAEKTIETAVFTVPEILTLKKAGVSDRTLQAAIRAGSFLKDRDPIVYGRAIRPIRLSSVEDIIEMHEAGFSDAALEAVLTVVNTSSETDRERALELLESMNIRVDLRGE